MKLDTPGSGSELAPLQLRCWEADNHGVPKFTLWKIFRSFYRMVKELGAPTCRSGATFAVPFAFRFVGSRGKPTQAGSSAGELKGPRLARLRPSTSA
jgi:hypothetical protein